MAENSWQKSNRMSDIQPHLKVFRGHLETFYALLKLAPPYHSIEKALTLFASELSSKTQEEQEQFRLDESLQKRMYYEVFIESGLYKKHRGIIAGLLKGSATPPIPKEYQYLIQPFLK